jgi:hypothetical protein
MTTNTTQTKKILTRKYFPLVGLLSISALGIYLMVCSPTLELPSRPDVAGVGSSHLPAQDVVESESAPDQFRDHNTHGGMAGAENRSFAPEAHSYGVELLRRGEWKKAEGVLADACSTGDLTSCLVLGDAYIERGQTQKAQEQFMVSCQGGQLPGCSSLLSSAQTDDTYWKFAFERLSIECHDQDNAMACAVLADSMIAQNDKGRARAYLGLACSRGDERSCARLSASGS